jgi:hypothetical protein
MKRLVLIITLLLGAVLAACQQAEVTVREREVTRVHTETIEVEGAVVEVTRVVREVVAGVPTPQPPNADPSEQLAWTGNEPISALAPSVRQSQRMIIKNGEIVVMVANSDEATDRAMQVAIDYGGYVINQRLWDGSDGHRYATVTIGVPVNQFEVALRALRRLGQVMHETAAGQDVTDEFVDLNSRLNNLQATQLRLRTFLEQARNVNETLSVHNELQKVEEQIGVIQGRMNYMQDRAAYSTIRIDINPVIPTMTVTPTPTITPTPTPTLTPTVTPFPTLAAWRPNDTAQVASIQLRNSSRLMVDFLIYNVIICGPWLFMLALFGLLFWRVYMTLQRPSPLIREERGEV